MSQLIVPQVPSGLTMQEYAEIIARVLKDIDWAFNGNISSQNVRNIAGFNVSNYEFKHISGLVGMSGYDAANPLATRYWSGNADKSTAPWRVNQSGQMFATDAFITGLITGSTIIGGIIKTAETGARIELTEGVLKGYSEDNNLHGLVFSPSLTSNFFDLFIYHDGAKLLEFIDNALSVIIRGTSDSVGMILGGAAAPTFGAGTWSFPGNVSFTNIITGSITGNAATADYADFAGTAAFADDLAPSGNIAWGQVLKSGSNLADLDTKNLSSLTEDSTHRSVTDAEKSTWNGKQAGDATLTALATYNTNGLLTQTTLDTFTGRTLTGTTNRISVTNGNGVSGNPTLDIGSDVVTLTATQTLTNKTLTQPSWIAPTLGNSWVNFGAPEATAGYRKDGAGNVRLKGLIKSGTTGTVIFTLPVGYRPLEDSQLDTVANNGGVVVIASIKITSTGSVILEAGANTWLSFAGKSFPAEQ